MLTIHLGWIAAVLLAAGFAAVTPWQLAANLPSRPELPDPLMGQDGRRVADRKAWLQHRRPELKELFQRHMYGRLPAPAKVQATIVHEDPQAFGGKANLKEIALAFGPEPMPRVHLLLVTPHHRSGPVPVFLGLNFCGNHALVNDAKVRLPKAWMYPNHKGVVANRATEAGRGSEIDVWSLEQSIARGYAVATFYNGDIDPDRGDVREGIQPYWIKQRLFQPGPEAAGTIMVWAWGLHRAIDYLVENQDLDPKRIAVVGHSRLGKATLLAAAFDERVALAIPHQAGCGGTAPSRGLVGESVKQINDRFPHWFNGNFKEFNDHTDRLPFDQHCLVALVAPRPVLFTNAVEDTWANPAGQFDVLRAADPVYRFLGVEGLAEKQMPEPGRLLASRLGYAIRPGKHSMTPGDWKLFLDFADRHFGKSGK